MEFVVLARVTRLVSFAERHRVLERLRAAIKARLAAANRPLLGRESLVAVAGLALLHSSRGRRRLPEGQVARAARRFTALARGETENETAVFEGLNEHRVGVLASDLVLLAMLAARAKKVATYRVSLILTQTRIQAVLTSNREPGLHCPYR